MLEITKERSAALTCAILVILSALFILYRANQLYRPIIRYDKFAVVEAGNPLRICIKPSAGRYATLEITNYNMTRDIAVAIRGRTSVRTYALFLEEHPDTGWWIYYRHTNEGVFQIFFWPDVEYEYRELVKKSLGTFGPSLPEPVLIRLGVPHTLPLYKNENTITIAPTEGSTVLRVRVLERSISRNALDLITNRTIAITAIIVTLFLTLSSRVGSTSLLTTGDCAAIATTLAVFGMFETALAILAIAPTIALALDAIIIKGKERDDK